MYSRRDAALRRSFETILERFSYSPSMDGDWTEPSSRKTGNYEMIK